MAVLIYILSLLVLTIFSYGFIDINFPIKQPLLLFNLVYLHRPLSVLIFFTLIITMFLSYLYFIKLVDNGKMKKRQMVKLIRTTVLILFFSFPAFSNDIFNYIATAKVTFFYQENPYLVMPIEFPGDPLLAFMHAANKTALYGPFWILLTAIPYFLGLGNLFLTIFTFKALMIGFYGLTTWLIWKISKHNLSSIVIFALNPLVIIEILVSAHNDIVMMAFVLLAFHWLQNKKIFKSYAAWFLSILIKGVSIFLMPLMLFVTRKIYGRQIINWDMIFLFSALMMIATIFILAPLREEIYPWYAIWFLIFISLIPQNKFIVAFSLVLSFALLCRYIPFLYFGNYLWLTQRLKAIITILPPSIYLIYLTGHKFFAKT